jgi:hypothetical protein
MTEDTIAATTDVMRISMRHEVAKRAPPSSNAPPGTSRAEREAEQMIDMMNPWMRGGIAFVNILSMVFALVLNLLLVFTLKPQTVLEYLQHEETHGGPRIENYNAALGMMGPPPGASAG